MYPVPFAGASRFAVPRSAGRKVAQDPRAVLTCLLALTVGFAHPDRARADCPSTAPCLPSDPCPMVPPPASTPLYTRGTTLTTSAFNYADCSTTGRFPDHAYTSTNARTLCTGSFVPDETITSSSSTAGMGLAFVTNAGATATFTRLRMSGSVTGELSRIGLIGNCAHVVTVELWTLTAENALSARVASVEAGRFERAAAGTTAINTAFNPAIEFSLQPAQRYLVLCRIGTSATSGFLSQSLACAQVSSISLNLEPIGPPPPGPNTPMVAPWQVAVLLGTALVIGAGGLLRTSAPPV